MGNGISSAYSIPYQIKLTYTDCDDAQSFDVSRLLHQFGHAVMSRRPRRQLLADMINPSETEGYRSVRMIFVIGRFGHRIPIVHNQDLEI